MPRSPTLQLDIEAAAAAFSGEIPLLSKPSQETLRWEFIRKIYAILSLQMLLTIAVSAAVIYAAPVALFACTPAGISLFVFILIIIVLVLFPLHYYRRYEPANLILLGVFTVSISLAVGLACAFIDGEVILESAVLTAGVLVSLTAYSFWAVNRGQDFSFLSPYLFSASLIIILSVVIQVMFPAGRLGTVIYGGLASLVFSAYIIYDTAKMIRAYEVKDYAWVSVMLYLDIINLFLSITDIFKRSNKE